MKSIMFPGKFLLGKNILASFANYAEALGRKFLVVSSKSVMATAKEKILMSIEGTEMKAEFTLFGGECSYKEICRLAEIGKENGCDCVVGIGGGKLLDASKSAALKLDAPVIVVPTIAATDAPCSALTVVYTENGIFEAYEWLPANPEIVMVDTEIICSAPVRYLVAGMGDALATYFEARAVRASNSNTCAVAAIGKQTKSAFVLAELCYHTLLADGLKAKLSAEAGVITPALENVIEANILLSGVGFESGGLAASHSIHNGMTVLPQTHAANHGEKVAFGVLTQLMMENAPIEEINTVLDFCVSVGLPVTFAELGMGGVSDAELWKVAEASTVADETIHCQPFDVTAETVFAALTAANAIGTAYLAGK